MAAAEHQHAPAGVAGALRAQHVRHAVADAAAQAARSPSAGRPLAPAGLGEAQVPLASITARGEQPALAAGAVHRAELEGLLLAACGPHLADAEAGDAGHARAEPEPRRDLGRGGERLEVALGELARRSGRRRRPAGSSRAARGGPRRPVEVEAPGREHRDMAPVAHRGADRLAGLEDHRLQPARQEVRRGREPDRPGADHRDGKIRRGRRRLPAIAKLDAVPNSCLPSRVSIAAFSVRVHHLCIDDRCLSYRLIEVLT